MRDHFGIRLADEFAALLGQPLTQFAKIFDNAVVHDRNQVGGVRMGIVLCRTSMGRPARMTDADGSAERLAFKARFKRAQLAFGASAAEHAFVEGGDARRVIAAIFETLERIDELAGDRLGSENSDDPAHPIGWPLCLFDYGLAAGGKRMEITTHFAV